MRLLSIWYNCTLVKLLKARTFERTGCLCKCNCTNYIQKLFEMVTLVCIMSRRKCCWCKKETILKRDFLNSRA